ncbi:hypothetical protein ABIF66_005101 [Bradyrhizobium japonicum]
MLQHLLHMCDLTSGITRTLRLLPESRSPLLLQVCFRGNTRLRLLQSDPSVLRRFCDTDRLLSSARTRFAHPEFFRCWPVWGTPIGPETVRLSRGRREVARPRSKWRIDSNRTLRAPRQELWYPPSNAMGRTKAAAPSSGTYCVSSPGSGTAQNGLASSPLRRLLGPRRRGDRMSALGKLVRSCRRKTGPSKGVALSQSRGGPTS